MEPGQPQAEAVVIQGNRIVAVGSNEAARRWLLEHRNGDQAIEEIDLRGKLLLPGFNDSHVHFMSGGFSLAVPDLRNTRTPQDFVSGIETYARTLPQGAWITGVDWDHEKWPGTPLPSRQWVDAAAGGRPLLASRFDGHMALANSRALELAGITKDTSDPSGGVIVRDHKGEPTGMLKDSAQDLVMKVIPPRSDDEKRVAAIAATDHAASLGVTSVTDVSADGDVPLYRKLSEEGRLKTRIYGAQPVYFERFLATDEGISGPDGFVRIGGVKGFSDGSLGSSTAFFFEPYADDPGNRGLLFDQMFPEGIMLERVRKCDKAGLQVMIHAIGDAANRIILDLYQQVALENGPRDRRFRIEHAQHLAPADLPRFARQDVIASMQPYHAADDGCWCDRRLGRERCAMAYPFKSLIESGAALAFGSDWTVAPLDPLLGIKAAVARQTLDGLHPQGWVPEQKITVEQAVRAYTMGSARAEFAENRKGSIAPGKLADLVVLSEDIFHTAPSRIDKARVIFTIVDGEVVFSAT
jgi:predicted amidohydrolase YtcJ